MLPFTNLLDKTIRGVTPEQSVIPYLWHTDGNPWGSDKITKILQRESHVALQVTLNISIWRHVAIAIDKKFLRRSTVIGFDAQQIESINHAWQAGHSDEVESTHYALTAETIAGLDEDNLVVFQRWQVSGAVPNLTLSFASEMESAPHAGTSSFSLGSPDPSLSLTSVTEPSSSNVSGFVTVALDRISEFNAGPADPRVLQLFHPCTVTAVT